MGGEAKAPARDPAGYRIKAPAAARQLSARREEAAEARGMDLLDTATLYLSQASRGDGAQAS